MSRDGSLWIGGLEPYMDEDFLMKCLNSLGETYSGIISIKVMKNKFSGGHGGFGFLNFVNDDVAISTMHKLNGKIMPHTNPAIRFKLNHKSTQKGVVDERNHSIWVGDLSPELDDFAVYNFFKERFKTTQSARIMVDETGTTRGFGFVRFGDEQEQMSALGTMDGKTGLGDRPIKVSTAYAKGTNPNMGGGGTTQSNSYGYGSSGTSSGYGGGAAAAAQTGGQDYSAQWAQYNQYWAQYNAWQQYYAANPGSEQQQGQAQADQKGELKQSNTQENKVTENGTTEVENISTKPKEKHYPVNVKSSILEGNAKEPVDNKVLIDLSTFEKEFFVRSEEMYWAIESSRWWYQCPI